jgi:hypothetical protein
MTYHYYTRLVDYAAKSGASTTNRTFKMQKLCLANEEELDPCGGILYPHPVQKTTYS